MKGRLREIIDGPQAYVPRGTQPGAPGPDSRTWEFRIFDGQARLRKRPIEIGEGLRQSGSLFHVEHRSGILPNQPIVSRETVPVLAGAALNRSTWNTLKTSQNGRNFRLGAN